MIDTRELWIDYETQMLIFLASSKAVEEALGELPFKRSAFDQASRGQGQAGVLDAMAEYDGFLLDASRACAVAQRHGRNLLDKLEVLVREKVLDEAREHATSIGRALSAVEARFELVAEEKRRITGPFEVS